MAVTLPDDLRSSLRGAVESLISPGAMLVFFPDVHVMIPQGAPLFIAVPLALDEAAKKQLPGASAGPLVTLGKQLEYVGRTVGKELLDWLANTGPTAHGADPYAALRVGGYRRPFIDHTRFRQHLQAAFDGDRRAVWVPPPLGADRRSLHELTLDIGAIRGQRVGSAEWVPSASMTMESVARNVAGAFSSSSPSPSTTTSAARAAELARWLWQEAYKAQQDVSFVFSGFRTPDSDDILVMILELMKQVHNTVLPGRRVRVILLDCEFSPSLGFETQNFKKTQEPKIDSTKLHGEIIDLLESTNALKPNAARELLGEFWTEPPDIPRIHEKLHELLEVLDDQ